MKPKQECGQGGRDRERYRETERERERETKRIKIQSGMFKMVEEKGRDRKQQLNDF